MHVHAMKEARPSETRVRRVLACLGDPSRFRLVRELAGGERCVGDLAVAVGLSQSCTTRHLQALEREGLVRGRRDGRRVWYGIAAGEAGFADLWRWLMGGAGPAPPPADERTPALAGAELHRDRAERGPEAEGSAAGTRRKDREEGAGARGDGREPRRDRARRSGGTEALPETGKLAPAPNPVSSPGGGPASPESEPGAGRPARPGDLEDYLL